MFLTNNFVIHKLETTVLQIFMTFIRLLFLLICLCSTGLFSLTLVFSHLFFWNIIISRTFSIFISIIIIVLLNLDDLFFLNFSFFKLQIFIVCIQIHLVLFFMKQLRVKLLPHVWVKVASLLISFRNTRASNHLVSQRSHLGGNFFWLGMVITSWQLYCFPAYLCHVGGFKYEDIFQMFNTAITHNCCQHLAS